VGEPVGIDVGLKHFAVLSTGEKIEAPKSLEKNLKRLRRLSRQHTRKQKGSNNRRKSAIKLARLHRRIRNQRRDF
ncbi:transposase, partial [Calderihabitans maritimus]